MSKITLLTFWSLLISSCGKQIHNIPSNQDLPLQTRLLNFLDECEKEGFSGTVLVQMSDSILLREGYGKSNRKQSSANSITTIFDIGSVTKQFTAAAIQKLQMNGMIQISDDIGTYIPELNSEKSALSIHQLLTHTAGLQEAIGEDENQIKERDFLDRINRSNLVHAPGEKYLYSNIGYRLLGI